MEKTDQYNSSALNVNNKLTGTTLSICNQIFKKLKNYYTSPEGIKEGYECRTIAKLFYWALQEYTEIPFVPTIITERPVKTRKIDKNEVIIIHIGAPLAEYHFIIACKYDETRYKIYSAFGAAFIKPFLISEKEFIKYCNRLINATFDKDTLNYTEDLNRIPFAEPWNAITHRDLNMYVKVSFCINMTKIAIDNMFDFIENLAKNYTPTKFKLLKDMYFHMRELLNLAKTKYIINIELIESFNLIISFTQADEEFTNITDIIRLTYTALLAASNGNVELCRDSSETVTRMLNFDNSDNELKEETIEDYWIKEIDTYFKETSGIKEPIYILRRSEHI